MLGVLLAAAVAAPCTTPPSLLTQTKAVGQALAGDVDGDGRSDRVSLRIAPRATVACGVFVVVRSAAGTRVARVWYSSKDPGTAGDLLRYERFPFLNGLYRLDGRRGLEVVVTAEKGASNSFLQFFGWRSGQLLRLAIPRSAGLGEISWGGFASAHSGIDCDRGLVRVSAAWLDKGLWNVERDFYRVDRAALRRVRTQRIRGSLRKISKWDRETNQARPFPSCRGVRARRQS